MKTTDFRLFGNVLGITVGLTLIFYKHVVNLAHKAFNFQKIKHVAPKAFKEKNSALRALVARFGDLNT